MKATFFTLATLAASAFAAPTPYQESYSDEGSSPAVSASIDEVALPSGTEAASPVGASGLPEEVTLPVEDSDAVTALPVEDSDAITALPEDVTPLPTTTDDETLPEIGEVSALPSTTGTPDVPGSGAPALPGVPEIGDVAGLIDLLTGLLGELTGSFGNIEALTGQVESGESTAKEVEPQVLGELSSIQTTLQGVLGQLTAQSGGALSGGDITGLLEILKKILELILSNGGNVAGVLSGSSQVLSLLSTILTLLTSILAVVVGLVVSILPGLLNLLGPLLEGLTNGALGPLLTPLTGLLGGLGSPDFVTSLTQTGPLSALLGSGLLSGLPSL